MTHTPEVKQPAAPLTEPQPPSVGRLVADASRDVSTLLRSEIALVKSEVVPTLRLGGMAAGLFAAAAFLVLLAVVIGSVALAYLIHLSGLNLAWCYLIVFFLYLLMAGVLGFIGYRKVKAVKPPERSIAQAKEMKGIFSQGSESREVSTAVSSTTVSDSRGGATAL